MTISEWLQNAKTQIPQLDAEVLAAKALGISRTTLIAHPELLAPDVLSDWLSRSIRGEPVAYIVGEKEFFGRKFFVDRNVLIPRPETETLIHVALERIREPIVADIGTGSGVIAITLALEMPSLRMIATDLSRSALSIAKRNANNLSAEIALLHADSLQPFAPVSLDAVVSNPPYVQPGDTLLDPRVADWEPPLALYAEGGTSHIEELTLQARRCLRPEGLLVFEFGMGQESEVKNLLQDWKDVQITQDLSGIPRVASAIRPD